MPTIDNPIVIFKFSIKKYISIEGEIERLIKKVPIHLLRIRIWNNTFKREGKTVLSVFYIPVHITYFGEGNNFRNFI